MLRVPRRRAVFYEGLAEALKDFAGRTFALSAQDKDGHSYRETLEGLLARTKSPERAAKLAEELRVAPLPSGAIYLWRHFLRLSARRGHNGWAALPLSWIDIDAYQRVTGFRFSPWEIDVIEDLDRLELRAAAAAQSGANPQQ